MSQDLAGNNSGWVTLSFWYSAREYTRAGSNGLQLSFGGQTIDLLGTDNLGPGHQWLQYSGSFLLNGSNDTLTFSALGSSDSYGTSLDKISPSSIALPHPERPRFPPCGGRSPAPGPSGPKGAKGSDS